MNLLTTTGAARRLGISRRRVLAYVAAGRLPAQRFGVAWMIQADDLAVLVRRKPGRPVTTGAGLRRKDRRARP